VSGCNCAAFGGAPGAVTSTGQPAAGTGLFGGTSTGSYAQLFPVFFPASLGYAKAA